jgi:uncharacterized protein YkwD
VGLDGTRNTVTCTPPRTAATRSQAAALALLVALGVMAPDAARADASLFCPRPTGRWWEDVAAHGCRARLAGRDAADPLTPVELRWLDLGALPAYAVVDVAAVDAALAASAPPPPPPPRPRPAAARRTDAPQELLPASPPPHEDWHDAMLAAVNDERAGSGTGPVTLCPRLMRVAQDYAEVLRDQGRIAHDGPDGSTPSDRAVRGGYRGGRRAGGVATHDHVGENLAAGHVDVPAVMLGWIGSPAHHANLLSGRWVDVGLGLARAPAGTDRYGTYWVQLFGDGTGRC